MARGWFGSRPFFGFGLVDAEIGGGIISRIAGWRHYDRTVDFYLGSHMPHWLRRPDVPLFVSHRRLARNKGVPRAATRWALDSGGFTELSMFGEWRTTPGEYVQAVARYATEIGRLDWAAPQDWMCEPWIVAKTGLSVHEHQRRTVDNFIELRQLSEGGPFIPVLQGWEPDDYLRHIDMYDEAGIDLTDHNTVGLGSVCRRQDTDEIGALIETITGIVGPRLHGFGVKGAGIRRYGYLLRSADSMSWSARGRRIQPCPHRGVTSCANCWDHALAWRSRALLLD